MASQVLLQPIHICLTIGQTRRTSQCEDLLTFFSTKHWGCCWAVTHHWLDCWGIFLVDVKRPHLWCRHQNKQQLMSEQNDCLAAHTEQEVFFSLLVWLLMFLLLRRQQAVIFGNKSIVENQENVIFVISEYFCKRLHNDCANTAKHQTCLDRMSVCEIKITPNSKTNPQLISIINVSDKTECRTFRGTNIENRFRLPKLRSK